MSDTLGESKIVNIFRRSSDAEGNPLHVPFTRLPYNNQSPVKLLFNGIEESFDWHRDKQVTERQGAGTHPNDRALLIQTSSHLSSLKMKFPTLLSFSPSNFGENIFIDGSLNSMSICVGDIINILRGNARDVVAVIQVTSPRWPCYKIDNKHSKILSNYKSEDKVRGYCAETGFGGFFCKVIKEGNLAPGDSLIISNRSCNGWTLSRISKLFYGGSNRKSCLIDKFQGTEMELQQILKLKELAMFEWRDRLENYVIQREKDKQKRKERNIKIIIRIMWIIAGIVVVALMWRIYTKN